MVEFTGGGEAFGAESLPLRTELAPESPETVSKNATATFPCLFGGHVDVIVDVIVARTSHNVRVLPGYIHFNGDTTD